MIQNNFVGTIATPSYMEFQSHDINKNAYSFGPLRIFINTAMSEEEIGMVKILDPGYLPRKTFRLNRTIVHPQSSTYVQMDIQLNLAEVVVPQNQGAFRSDMLKHIVNFMLRSIKVFTTPTIANEMGFKIIFYAPSNSPASTDQWWSEGGVTRFDWVRDSNPWKESTLLGTSLNGVFVRYTLKIHLDGAYNLIKHTSVVSSVTLSAAPLETGGGGVDEGWLSWSKTPTKADNSNLSRGSSSGIASDPWPTVPTGGDSLWGNTGWSSKDTTVWKNSKLTKDQGSGWNISKPTKDQGSGWATGWATSATSVQQPQQIKTGSAWDLGGSGSSLSSSQSGWTFGQTGEWASFSSMQKTGPPGW